jgi:hypothetical protein
MKSFSGLKGGEIIFRVVKIKPEYYLYLPFGVLTLYLSISFLFYIGNDWIEWIAWIIFFVFSLSLISIADESRSEYFVIYYNDCLVFCFIDKHLLKKSEIYNFQLHFRSVLNFQTAGENHDKILFRFIEKERDILSIQNRDDQLGAYMRHTDWCLVKEYKGHTNEVVDFLNQRVQENKLS